MGQVLWLSLVRPDLQHAARDLSKHLVQPPTQLDLQQLKHVFATSKALSITNFIFVLQPPPGIHLPLPAGQQTPLLIECYSDSDWAGDINTRQSTSGSLITLLKNNMHSSNKTQQVIATSSAEAELYAISSTISNAIHLKQLITEIEDNIGIKTFDLTKHNPNIVLFCDSSSATSLVQCMGINKRTKHIQLRFLWIQDLHQAGQLVLRRVSTENNPADAFAKTLPAAHLQRHLPAVGVQTDVANEAGEYNKIFFVVDNIKKQRHLQATLGQQQATQQLHPQQALQQAQLPHHQQLRPATSTDHQQQLSGQQLSIIQLSGGQAPTTTATLNNRQQIDQHQSAGRISSQHLHPPTQLYAAGRSSISQQQQQQDQQTTCDRQLFCHNELFMIQHQADSSDQPRDPPISATTRRDHQRSSLEIIAEALNRQQERRGRRHLSPQPILTPLSSSSVGVDASERKKATTTMTMKTEDKQQ